MRDDEREGQSSSGDAADDALWLAALAGRTQQTEDQRAAFAVQEASLMRDALRLWAVPVDQVASDDPERIARLIERARREGLIDAGPASRPSGPGPSTIDRLRAWWHAASLRPLGVSSAAIALLLVVLASTWVWRTSGIDPEQPTVRGAPDAVIVLTAPDPEALRRELVAALSGQGIRATTYQRFGRLGVDADLPEPLPDALRALLGRYRIPVPPDGVLRVEIEPRRP